MLIYEQMMLKLMQCKCPNARLTPRVLQPSPLKESRPEIQGGRLSKEEKHVNHIPTSVIALGYLASNIREAILVTTLSNTCSSW
jgi:hypothetical protein